MPEDTVRLGIRVDSKTVVTADDRLDKLGKTAATTERKTDRMGKQSKKSGNQIAKMGRQSSQASVGIKKAAKAAGAFAASFLIIQTAINSLTLAKGFDAALAETSTLIKGTRAEMMLLSDSAIDLSNTFGGAPKAQVQAFYQAISGGADGVKGAADVLDAANKLAIGGVTSLATGVSVLNTAVNVYGPEVLSAAEASDALFIAMKTGVTTIGELGSAVGRVLPLAKAAGVNFDEVTASIAALTKGGISTNESVTGLRAILAAVIKPTKEASDAAKRLGLNFSVSALETKGLAGFLGSLKKATGGSTEEMALLFGGVEALTPALSLMGKSGEYLVEILEDMENKAGATDDAFEKMQASLSKRLDDSLGRIRNKFQAFGTVLLNLVTPAVETFSNHLEIVVSFIKAGAVALTVALIPALIIAAKKVTLFTASLIANRAALIGTGWGAIAVGIGAIVLALDTYFNSANDAGEVTTELSKAVAIERDTYDDLMKAMGDVNTGSIKSIGNARTRGIAHLKAAAGVRQEIADQIALARILNSGKITDYQARVFSAQEKIAKSRKDSLEFNNSVFPNAKTELEKLGGMMPFAGRIQFNKQRQIVERYTKAIFDMAQVEKGLIDTLDESAKKSALVEAALEGMTAAAARTAATGIEEKYDLINNVWVKVVKSGDDVTRTLINQGKTAEDLADTLQNKLVGAVGSVADAFGEFITGGLRDFKGFAKSILDTFKNLFKDLIAESLKRKILINLGFNLDGSGAVRGPARKGSTGERIIGFFDRFVSGGGGRGDYAAKVIGGGSGSVSRSNFPRLRGSGANAAGAGGGLGKVFSNVSSFLGLSGIGTSIVTGISTLISGPVVSAAVGTAITASAGAGLGIGASASAASTAATAAGAGEIGAGVAGIGAGVLAAVPYVAAALAVAYLLKGIFKGSKRVTDTNLDINFRDGSVDARTGTTTRTKKFFRGPSYNTAYKAVDAEFLAVLNKFNTDSRSALNTLGQTFGVENALERFVSRIKFSTKGLSEDQINTRVTQELEAVREAMARLIVGSSDFVREGETFVKAAERMAQGIGVVNTVFDRLGLRMFDISRAGANAASTLTELLGGIQGFTSASQFYFTNFFDAAERLTINNKALSDTLAALGVVDVPKTRIAFRGLIQEMQEIGNTGAVATLLKIAPLFIEIAGAADEAANANARLFRTRADEVFANSGPVRPFTRDGSGQRIPSTAEANDTALLRELLDELRNGNVALVRNTDKSARILDRMERKDETP